MQSARKRQQKFSAITERLLRGVARRMKLNIPSGGSVCALGRNPHALPSISRHITERFQTMKGMKEIRFWRVTFDFAGKTQRMVNIAWDYKPSGLEVARLVEFAREAAAKQAPTTNPRALTFCGIAPAGNGWRP